MASTFIAQCQGCDFQQDIIGRNNYAYQLSEPPDVFLWVQFAWCSSCRKVVQAEQILTTAEMNERAEMNRRFAGSHNRSRQDMERYRQMTDSRISPARCLECGSTNIVAAIGDWPNYRVLHSICGASIVLHHNGFARLNGTNIYSPEGEHLTTVEGTLVPGRGY